MSIPESSLKEFQELYKKEFGVDLSMDEARQLANNLIHFFNLILNE